MELHAMHKKYKQLFKYQHLLLLRDGRLVGQSTNLYLNVVRIFNTSVN